jgi:hypothetical protein
LSKSRIGVFQELCYTYAINQETQCQI